jgi:pimeloyl-ACP methyl ester carboxylesterase
VLAMNSRFFTNEAGVVWEDLPLDVKTGVEFLQKQPGITKVVLFAHSGGGATMAFYQALAENGPAYSQGVNKLIEGETARLAGLPRADGIVFADAHPGIPVNLLRSLNPAVVTEGDTNQLNPELDAFNPSNGYNANGPSRYSEEFKQRYFKAQAERMNRLIALAQEQLKQGKLNEPFQIVHGGGAGLANLDPSINARTLQPRKFLKNDGSIATQFVERVRPPAGTGATGQSARSGTRQLTVMSFLSANAIRATNSMDAVDWCSCNGTVDCAVQKISVPILVSAMGTHSFIRDGEVMFELATSRDKDFIVIEGATHNFTPCRECETTPGQYSNSVKNYFDHVAAWINARF